MSKIKNILEVLKIVKNWSTYFTDYFHLINSSHTVYRLKNGISLMVRSGSNDRVIFNQVWLNNVYLPNGFEIKDDDIVIDIGAHIGLFAVLAAFYAKKGKIYAFEPVKENFELLNENINQNKITNILTYNKAVSGDGEMRDFVLSSGSNAAHSFDYTDSKSSKKVKVQTVRLEDFINENEIKKIDFFKIDCEGAEYEIIFNLPKNLLKIIKKIGMEYHDIDGDRNVTKMKKYLEDNGFSVRVETIGDNMLYARQNQ